MDVLIRMLYIPIVLYLSLAIYALFFSDSAIFLPHSSSYRDTAGILKIRSANGNMISALYLRNPSAAFTLLVSHGNAEDLGDDREWLEDLRNAGFSVLAYDYQGYGTSQGKPAEKTAYEDEIAAYEYLTHELKTLPEHIIIFGRSVGSGPAVHLAARRPAAALILQSPFVSAFRVLTRIPLLPFDKFPNYKEIGRVHCPVLIVHGAKDSVIPIWHGRKLFDAANQPKQFVVVPDADHNDLNFVAGASYFQTLQAFQASLATAQFPAKD
ncbi:MAG TPA: alpha/beta hydrolase [Candidatus Angelobacter sp.]|nr:alpha/beta hydrolase [Candidatus Angelobacter sp.]